MLVKVAGGGEFALRPEHNFLVAGGAGKADALGDQTLADSQAAGRGLDQQQAKFGDRSGFLHQENGSDVLAVFLGNPAALAGRVEILNELGNDVGYESFEALIISVLLVIEEAMAVDDP